MWRPVGALIAAWHGHEAGEPVLRHRHAGHARASFDLAHVDADAASRLFSVVERGQDQGDAVIGGDQVTVGAADLWHDLAALVANQTLRAGQSRHDRRVGALAAERPFRPIGTLGENHQTRIAIQHVLVTQPDTFEPSRGKVLGEYVGATDQLHKQPTPSLRVDPAHPRRAMANSTVLLPGFRGCAFIKRRLR